MRDASPTGGALGQVSERELGYLQSVLGSLEQSQTADELRAISDYYKSSTTISFTVKVIQFCDANGAQQSAAANNEADEIVGLTN